MAPDLSASLLDILGACIAIEDVMRDIALEDDRRQCAVAFGNLLAHDYEAVDDDSVFGLVYSDLGVLRVEVKGLLRDLFGAP